MQDAHIATCAGTKSPKRVAENLKAASLQLSEKDLADLEAAVPIAEVCPALAPLLLHSSNCSNPVASYPAWPEASACSQGCCAHHHDEQACLLLCTSAACVQQDRASKQP